MIMELVRNRSFTLTTGDSKQSRLRYLRNGLPQGSVWALLLFNIYTYDLPSMTSQKYAYANELALLYASQDWKAVEDTLSQDMITLSANLQTCRLKLSNIKTETAAFHLTTERPTVSLIFTAMAPIATLSSPNVSWDKAGQVAHFPLPPRGIAQKTLHPSRAVEATCVIRMVCKCPRHCTSLLFLWSTPQLSTAHQFSLVVRILASLTAFSMMLCALSLNACVPHQRRTCLSSQTSSQLSSAD